MAYFQAFLPLLEKVEGGYQASSKDKGNYNSLNQLVGTNWGISAKTYEDWINRPPTISDMKNLLKGTAIEIYKNWFWQPMLADLYINQSVANLIVDHAVNAGVPKASKMLQQVLNGLGNNLIIDGKVGSKTIAALNSANQEKLHKNIKLARINYYEDQDVYFLNGWLNRLNSFFFEQNKTTYLMPLLAFGFVGFIIIKNLGNDRKYKK